MPYILTSQEWLAQSALLIEARPTTARVSTKYNIKPSKARAARKAAIKEQGAGGNDEDRPMTDAAADTKPPRASLIIKTFDPHSGVCLKYKTTKAAEVSRLVQLLGALGRKMAALPDAPAPVAAAAAAAAEDEAAAGTATPPGAAGTGAAVQQAQAGAGGGGGGKKKKKGKR